MASPKKSESTDDDFEASDIVWEDFFNIITGIVKTGFEAVVAEIIDNSVDAKAKKIFVEIVGYSKEDFAVIVFDDGLGFRTRKDKAKGGPATKEGLKEAFSLAGSEAEEGVIGKFNIGLKITPLSKCNRVSALCRLDSGEVIHRGLDKKVNSEKKAYGTFTNDPGTKATKHARKVLESKSNDYRSAVILYDFQKMPIKGTATINDQKKADLGRYLRSYFGVIYQKSLEREDAPRICIFKDKLQYEVKPKDPFWSDLTPSAIDARLGLPASDPGFIPEDHRYLLECFKEWGTIKTEKQRFDIPVEDETTGEVKSWPVYVTGYIIPSINVHKMLPDKYKAGNMWTAPYSDLDRMKAEQMGGLYFYRGDRCICFGTTRTDGSNRGWYGIHTNVESFLNKTRVKVEFDANLDNWIDLAPTKDCVDPEDDFFDKVRQALNQQVSDPELRAGLGLDRQFFKRNLSKDASDFVVTLSNHTSSQKQINKDCEFCGDESPPKNKPWHHIDTRCPKQPCDICGNGCLPGECDYICSHDHCGENHLEENCDLNCPYCEYPEGAGGHPEGEDCPHMCQDCSYPERTCQCTCPRGCGGTVSVCECCSDCEKPRDESGQCECPGGGKESSNLSHEDTTGTVRLKLIKGDERNDELIRQAREFLGLD